MYAAQMVGRGRVEIVDVPIPSISDGQVLVRMAATSICGSDLHQVFGEFGPEVYPAEPGRPGHEGIGFVEESSSNLFSLGDPVLTVPYSPRATCFAEYHVAEEWSLVKLPTGENLLGLLMAQQLGTVIYAMKSFWNEEPPECAAIVGGGSAGLFFLQLLKRMGAEKVVLSDPNSARRKLAQHLGASRVVDPTTESLAAAASDMVDGVGSDLVIEAAGTELARVHAVECARPGGRLGLFGFPERPGVEPFPLAEAWRKTLTMVASANTQLEPGIPSFKEAVELISTGAIPVDHLMAENGPRDMLDDVQGAFDQARDGTVGKVVMALPSLASN